MRITSENGKRYRAYSPEEFFKSTDNTPTPFNFNKPKPKNDYAKALLDEKSQESR